MNSLKTRFLKTYTNLPLPVRNELAVVIGDEPISWNVLKVEVDNKTDLAKEALRILDKLNYLVKDEKN